MLHAGNDIAMRPATLESWLEELAVLRSFSWPRFSNDNPDSEWLFRIVKYLPDSPRRPFRNLVEASSWVATLVLYNDQHRHIAIRFMTPSQHHSGAAWAICRQLTQADVQA